MNEIPVFQPGDPAPRFQAPTGEHPVFLFDQVAGRYVVLSLFGSLQTPAVRKSVAHIVDRHRHWFDDQNACFFGVSIDPADLQSGLLGDAFPGIRYFRDFDGAVSKLYGTLTANPEDGGRLLYKPVTLVLDPMLRVLAVLPIDPAHDLHFDHTIAVLQGEAGRAAVSQHAPVLILPRIFEPDLCARLIACFEAGGGNASGVMEDVAGKTQEVHDAQIKKRRDVFITDDKLQREISARLTRRLLPVIRQAFQFGVTRIERYLIACYNAESGSFFAAHRDDTTRATAHRRFAVTINLNSGYEGGDLAFPEFGLMTYRAPPGGAAVFSCSLLHLVTPVLRGKRYAFLPFLHDDAAEAVRNRNLKFRGRDVLHRN